MSAGQNFNRLNMGRGASVVIWENPKQRELIQLIVRRDFLKSETRSIEIRYYQLFGELLMDIQRTVFEYTQLGYLIEFYQKKINQGEKVDAREAERYAEERLNEKLVEMSELFGAVSTAMSAVEVPQETAEDAKAIYRRIAKKIHPDFNPEAMENPDLKALWVQVQESYENYDVDRLVELELLTNRVLNGSGVTASELNIPDVDERIKRIHIEIAKIISTKPYTLIELISPEENAELERERLENMLSMYRSMLNSRKEAFEEKKREVEEA